MLLHKTLRHCYRLGLIALLARMLIQLVNTSRAKYELCRLNKHVHILVCMRWLHAYDKTLANTGAHVHWRHGLQIMIYFTLVKLQCHIIRHSTIDSTMLQSVCDPWMTTEFSFPAAAALKRITVCAVISQIECFVVANASRVSFGKSLGLLIVLNVPRFTFWALSAPYNIPIFHQGPRLCSSSCVLGKVASDVFLLQNAATILSMVTENIWKFKF